MGLVLLPLWGDAGQAWENVAEKFPLLQSHPTQSLIPTESTQTSTLSPRQLSPQQELSYTGLGYYISSG